MDRLRQDLSFAEFKRLVAALQERYHADASSLFELLSDEVYVPVTVFGSRLSALETITKYLHENLKVPYKKIAQLLNRSEKTVWQAHHFAKKKVPEKLAVAKSPYLIPVSALSNRRYSTLESVVLCLKTYGLRLSDIARLLERDQRTIWTVHSRARKKAHRKAY